MKLPLDLSIMIGVTMFIMLMAYYFVIIRKGKTNDVFVSGDEQ